MRLKLTLFRLKPHCFSYVKLYVSDLQLIDRIPNLRNPNAVDVWTGFSFVKGCLHRQVMGRSHSHHRPIVVITQQIWWMVFISYLKIAIKIASKISCINDSLIKGSVGNSWELGKERKA